VFCDASKGCSRTKIAGCSDKCTAKNSTDCATKGAALSNSTVQKCILGVCYVKKTTSATQYEVACDYSKSVNCTETMASEVARLNSLYKDRCYTADCGSDGQCIYRTVKRPDNYIWTKCMEPVCKKMPSGSYAWSYVATEVNKTCKSDACSYRECRNDANATLFPDGCYWEDICLNRTTECEIYTCDTSGATAQCKMTPAKFEETECTKEVCKNGKKVWVDKDIEEACHPPDKCYESLCYNGTCEYVKKDPDGDDPCIIYTCDPATGNFSKKPKCDDGLFCTTNYCDAFGECIFEPISCEGNMSMEGYPCFEPYCKEGVDSYKCVRKLLRNAYIDVCGNCIEEKKPEEVVTSSDASTNGNDDNVIVAPSSSQSSSGVDLLECTGAPPRPIITEGLAAASVALIIIAAIVGGVGVAASGIIGTKVLIDRAKEADNQSAHSNPLYQNNETELQNPAFSDAV